MKIEGFLKSFVQRALLVRNENLIDQYSILKQFQFAELTYSANYPQFLNFYQLNYSYFLLYLSKR